MFTNQKPKPALMSLVGTSISKIIYIYKNLGETPLEALHRLRVKHPEYEGEKLSYAGRLDPMAEGVMLVLAGDENKNREKYLNMQKEYEFEVLFGFSTDTFDLLGLVTEFAKEKEVGPQELNKALQNFKGVRTQEYPSYSSKTVAGKPMFEYARAGKLDEIEIPKREIEIFDIELLDTYQISREDLLESALGRINKVKGDFRQAEIKEGWIKILSRSDGREFTIAKIRMHASSGTYARSVASELGKILGIPALAYSIKRTAYK